MLGHVVIYFIFGVRLRGNSVVLFCFLLIFIFCMTLVLLFTAFRFLGYLQNGIV